MDLNKIRHEIDEIDDDLTELIIKRMEIVKDVAEYKSKTGTIIKDKKREDDIIVRLTNNIDEEYQCYVKELFNMIFELSRSYQSSLLNSETIENRRPDLSDLTNIILIGMPGSGKSSLGEILSKKTGKDFIDIDEEVEKAENLRIPEIFNVKGEEYFRDLESQMIADVCESKRQIISTGGGAVLRLDNQHAMKRNGIIVWIKRDIAKLGMDGRPLSKDTSSLKRMYSVRKIIYENICDIKIDNNEAVETAADNAIKKISELLNENGESK